MLDRSFPVALHIQFRFSCQLFLNHLLSKTCTNFIKKKKVVHLLHSDQPCFFCLFLVAVQFQIAFLRLLHEPLLQTFFFCLASSYSSMTINNVFGATDKSAKILKDFLQLSNKKNQTKPQFVVIVVQPTIFCTFYSKCTCF